MKVFEPNFVEWISREWPTAIIALGGLLTLLGSISRAVLDGNLQKELAQKSDELARKSDLISSLNLEMLRFTTGAGFPFAGHWFYPDTGETVHFKAENRGDYPLYDVSITVIDQHEVHKHSVKTVTDRAMQTAMRGKVFHIGTLHPGSFEAPEFLAIPLAGENSISLNFKFAARNGVTHQRVRGLRIDGKIRFATQVIGGGKSSILYEQIDPALRTSGYGDWSKLDTIGIEKRHKINVDRSAGSPVEASQ